MYSPFPGTDPMEVRKVLPKVKYKKYHMIIPCRFLLLITTQKIRCFLNNFLAGDGCVLRTHTHVRCYISRDEKKSVEVVYEAPLMTYVVTASSAPLHKCAYIEYTKSQVSNVSYYRHSMLL